MNTSGLGEKAVDDGFGNGSRTADMETQPISPHASSSKAATSVWWIRRSHRHVRESSWLPVVGGFEWLKDRQNR
jgi:hypothetical protein